MFVQPNPVPTPIKCYSESDLASLKKRAKRIKKDNDSVSHSRALDVVAIEQGFSNWKTLLKQNSQEFLFNKLFRESMAIVFDIKDYLDFEASASVGTWWQMSDEYNAWLMQKLYIKSQMVLAASQNEIDEPETLAEFLESMHYVAVMPSTMPVTHNEIESFVTQCMGHSFFVPDYFVVRGMVLSAFGPAEDAAHKRLQDLIGVVDA